VKIFLFVFVGLFCITNCFAQDTANHKNWLTNTILEKYKTLKPDEKTRVGPYKAYYKRRTLIADGRYDKGVKVGIWSFYDDEGKLNEKYDFDKTEYIYEAPLDTDTDVHFAFDAPIKVGDRVTRPLKIGGMYFGLAPYVGAFRLPFDTEGINLDFFYAIVELLVSPGGRLADYKVRLLSKAYKYDQTFNFDVGLFGEEDKQFTPASVNRQPVLARIFIRCSINYDGSLDFY